VLMMSVLGENDVRFERGVSPTIHNLWLKALRERERERERKTCFNNV
jgi:hypothetical protein